MRKAGFSEGNSCDLIGAFIPFFRTKVERMAANDPRPSLEERYPTHDFYVEKVRAAAARLVADRFLLPQDAELIVAQAQGAAIPWPIDRSDPKIAVGTRITSPSIVNDLAQLGARGSDRRIALGPMIAAAREQVRCLQFGGYFRLL